MGMFDNVKYKAPCWNCGESLTDFQTKSGECLMENLTPKALGSGNFYTICHKCRAWNEYDVTAKEVEIVLNLKKSKFNTDPHA